MRLPKTIAEAWYLRRKQKIAESAFPGAFPDAQSWDLNPFGRVLQGGLNCGTISGPCLEGKCLCSEWGLLRNAMIFSDTRFYMRPFFSFQCLQNLWASVALGVLCVWHLSHEQSGRWPPDSLRTVNRQYWATRVLQLSQRQSEWVTWQNLLLGDLPPHLHVCFQWRPTLGRSLKWTCPCWVQNLRPRAASEDSNFQPCASQDTVFLRCGWFRAAGTGALCSVFTCCRGMYTSAPFPSVISLCLSEKGVSNSLISF